LGSKKIYIADLTHTANGISAQTFPLGASYVLACAQHKLGNKFQFKLFRFPEQLTQAIIQNPPEVIAFSNYSWNFELSYRIAHWAKKMNPGVVIVFGGPNFPVSPKEQYQFLEPRPDLDIYIRNEGEIGFTDLIKALGEFDFDIHHFKEAAPPPINSCYLSGNNLVHGKLERITDLQDIPSPYLSGALDAFFELPLIPMIETTRGCPFKCTFCADGLASKNSIARFSPERVEAELSYIGERVRQVDDLIITDLNFGMYKQDIATVEAIAELQNKKFWPIIVTAAMGKNMPDRVIEAAAILKGSWKIGSSVQSWDAEVLENIDRSNISLDAYNQFIDFANNQGPNAEPYTELILGLPGDSLQKHFESLRRGIESGAKNIRIHQAILLHGTSMASQATREKFEIHSRVRVVPGCAGIYKFATDDVPVAEFEEIIVQTKDLPFADYVSCRKMGLLVETYFNRGMFEEIFNFTSELGTPVFDVLEYLYVNEELYSEKIKTIFLNFATATTDDLFENFERANEMANSASSLNSYLSGDTAKNELLEFRAALYLELAETSDLLVMAVTRLLKETGKWKREYANLLKNLSLYIVMKKQDIRVTDGIFEHQFDYDLTEQLDSNTLANLLLTEQEGNSMVLRFSHTDKQKSHIQNATRLSEHSATGLGKMLQFNNLRAMFRTVERVSEN
jgi:hypothetical protein